MSESFYILKVILPKGYPAKVPWRPAFVQFQTDADIKGVALFTSWLAADNFKNANVEACSLDMVIEEFDVESFFKAMIEHFGLAKAYKEVAVYIDPTDPYCKGKSVDFASVEKFLLKHGPPDLPWTHEIVGFGEHKGFTLMNTRETASNQYVTMAMKGSFKDRAEFADAVDAVAGTNEAHLFHRTKPRKSVFEAVVDAKNHIDRDLSA